MDESEGTGSAGGLRPALARLAASAVALVRTRIDLAGVELAEERERTMTRLALFAGGALLSAFALLFAGVLVIAIFWDTHRLAAIAGVAAVHLVAGVALIRRAKAIGQSAPTPFAATLAELEKDRRWLAGTARDAGRVED